jgi:hypothetical protein
VRYFDKNDREIEKWMFLRHDNGEVKMVWPGFAEDGSPSLGFSASITEIYPLHQFDLSEWEICDEAGNPL